MQLIVIGGGAAGFFCAVTAARLNPSLKVTIVEKSNKLLSKVSISGGGRCNVTHACFSIPEMSKKYPRGERFVRKTFHQFFTSDTIAWFRERGVVLKTEQDGRMFPVTDRSDTIIECLMREARKYHVDIVMKKEVKQLIPQNRQWHLGYADGTEGRSDFICVASGGYPKTGMFAWITATGHHVEEPVPSLFTFNIPGSKIKELMGVSARAKVKIQELKMEEEGPVLITHWGLSGPAVLKLSARAARELAKLGYRFHVLINWNPAYNEQTFKHQVAELRSSNGSQKVMGRSNFDLPQRLWEYLCSLSQVDPQTRWADLSTGKLNLLAKNVCAHELLVEGKTTYKEEFVTAGGVKLSEIDHNTMESKVIPTLYFAGEIMDVDGITGGFNFQHAWTSGWIAGRSIANRSAGGDAFPQMQF